MEIAVINNAISRLKILDKMMDVAIAQKKLKWDNSESKKQFSNIFRIDDEFKDEIDKSNDRNLTLEQIGVDLQGLRSSVEQRMDLIMTKNSEFLNDFFSSNFNFFCLNLSFSSSVSIRREHSGQILRRTFKTFFAYPT